MNRQSEDMRSVAAGTIMLSLFVSGIGIAVMLGWIFDIGWLKSIRPDFVTMKFTTAFSFLLSGITFYYVSRIRFFSPAIAMTVLPVTVMCIVLIMFSLLASTMFDLYIGIEALFVEEGPEAVETVMPGRPSIGTMIAFLLVAYTGIAAMLRPANLPLQLAIVGAIIFMTGAVAVVGYILDMPMLYYYVEGGHQHCHGTAYGHIVRIVGHRPVQA